jgi:hypothetical protein
MILEPEDKIENGDIIYYNADSQYETHNGDKYAGKSINEIRKELELDPFVVVAIARDPIENELALIQYWRPL